ncbi:MAG TPA: hypothetical protein VNO30_18085 [Kofleriaceae bacterium]|nr:hypothetical protein [Kofleriaceae bacterium]
MSAAGRPEPGDRGGGVAAWAARPARRRPQDARLALSLVLVASAACGGPVGRASPQERGRAHLVRCKAAPPLPSLAPAEGQIYGALLGEGGGGIGIGTLGVLRSGPLPGLGANAPVEKPATAVVLGTPAVTGALAPAAITRVLAHRVPELAACAPREAQLLASGPAASKAIVEWRLTIGASGKVIQAGATSHVLSEPVAACVTSVVRAAAFPAPPDGRIVSVILPIAFDATGAAPAPPVTEAGTPWTPFALDPAEAENVSEQVARAAEGALRGKLPSIDACFASSPVTGSLRAMLAVDSSGELSSVRAGGLGDKAVEACVENAVTGLRVMLPSETSGELACDLSRGDARPWRVTPDREGYGVVEISRTRVRAGDQMLSLGEEPDTLADHAVYLLVADADAPGPLLWLALRWTADATATLVAVRAGGSSGGPPVLVGAGLTAAADVEDAELARPTLEVGAAAVTACAGSWTHTGRLADPAAVDGAAQQLAGRCRTHACGNTLAIAVDRDAVAKDLVAVASAARRAGFDRVLLMRGTGGPPAADGAADDAPGTGSTAGCTPARGDEP